MIVPTSQFDSDLAAIVCRLPSFHHGTFDVFIFFLLSPDVSALDHSGEMFYVWQSDWRQVGHLPGVAVERHERRVRKVLPLAAPVFFTPQITKATPWMNFS